MTAPDFLSFFHRRPEKWGTGRYGVSRHRAFTVYRGRKRGRSWPVVTRYGQRAPVPRRGRYLDTRKTRGLRRALARFVTQLDKEGTDGE